MLAGGLCEQRRERGEPLLAILDEERVRRALGNDLEPTDQLALRGANVGDLAEWDRDALRADVEFVRLEDEALLREDQPATGTAEIGRGVEHDAFGFVLRAELRESLRLALQEECDQKAEQCAADEPRA